MLGEYGLIHAVEDHVLLHFFDLDKLAWQVLVWCLKLEVSLEVHLSLLLQLVSCNHVFHLQAVLLLLFFSLAQNSHWIIPLKVFELELFFLVECSVIRSSRHLVTPWIVIFLDVMACQSWVHNLTLEFLEQVLALQNACVLFCPLVVLLVEPIFFGLFDAHLSPLKGDLVVVLPSLDSILVALQPSHVIIRH